MAFSLEKSFWYLWYYKDGEYIVKQIDNFDGNLHYRLYSNIGKIIHPTISKNNISSYKVVLSEDVLPVRIFYPERV